MTITVFNWWFNITWDDKLELHLQLGWASVISLVIYTVYKFIRKYR